MDIEDKVIEEAEISAVEYAPKGMFPEDDDEDSFEIDVDEDLDVWNRGGGYTWGGGTSWWQRSYGGSYYDKSSKETAGYIKKILQAFEQGNANNIGRY